MDEGGEEVCVARQWMHFNVRLNILDNNDQIWIFRSVYKKLLPA